MDIKKLKTLKGLKLDLDTIEVDATTVIEHAFFEQHPNVSDYRKTSIDYMINNKIDFHSTCNNSFNILKDYVKLVCPSCKSDMIIGSGGGNSNSSTLNYTCSHCKIEASLTIPNNNGIFFKFNKT